MATPIALFDYWYGELVNKNLRPSIAVAKTLEKRVANVMSDCTPGVTSGVAEGNKKKDHRHQAASRWASDQGELQHRHLPQLRRTPPSPHETRMDLIKE